MDTTKFLNLFLGERFQQEWDDDMNNNWDLIDSGLKSLKNRVDAAKTTIDDYVNNGTGNDCLCTNPFSPGDPYPDDADVASECDDLISWADAVNTWLTDDMKDALGESDLSATNQFVSKTDAESPSGDPQKDQIVIKAGFIDDNGDKWEWQDSGGTWLLVDTGSADTTLDAEKVVQEFNHGISSPHNANIYAFVQPWKYIQNGSPAANIEECGINVSSSDSTTVYVSSTYTANNLTPVGCNFIVIGRK